MNITTDAKIFFEYGFLKINSTLLFSWLVIFLIISFSIFLNFCIRSNKITNIQSIFESLILIIENQVKQVSSRDVLLIFPFISTMFIYIFVSNLISLVPAFDSPTASLSTTLSLAILTFIFSIIIGIKQRGFFGYMSSYFEPIFLLFPLNLVSEISKIISLSFRLYGNIMSSMAILFILSNISFLSIGFPVLISLLGTIGGVIQAYIFTILSMIAISSDN